MTQGVAIFLLTIVPYEISTEYDEYDGPCIAMEIIQDLLKLRGQVTQVYHHALLWFRDQIPRIQDSGWRMEERDRCCRYYTFSELYSFLFRKRKIYSTFDFKYVPRNWAAFI